MMKHESVMTSTALPIEMPLTAASKRHNHDMIRCINDVWHSKKVNTSGVAASSPKSPIIKAFDFLPWSRSRKQQHLAATTTVEKHDEIKKDPTNNTHYQKNIFRNGGGIIRDILTDRLNKDRARDSSLGRLDMKRVQKKSKQLSRNKSLDINELIDTVENELAAEKKQDVRNRFMDDTFIENIIRAKSEENENSGGRTTTSTEVGHSEKPSNGKHILFNDENVVYLIKDEVRSSKRPGRSISKKDDNHRSSSKSRGSSSPRPSSMIEEGTSIVKGRLRFKKVSQEEKTTTTMVSSATSSNSRRRATTIVGGIPPASPSSLSTSSSSSASTAVAADSAGGKRGILHRQNTSPNVIVSLAPTTTTTSPNNQQQEYGSQILRRRKSFNEINFENNSSSSSLGVGGGLEGGVTDDRPKSDKPRKKLSFREPVVAPRSAERRISTPIQQQHQQQQYKNPEDTSSKVFDNKYAAVNSNVGGNGGIVSNGNGNSSFGDVDSESHAMRIVRTVGQAFEVCHKFNLHKNSLDNNEERSDASSDLLDVEHTSEQLSDEDLSKKDQIGVTPDISPPQRPNHLELTSQMSSANQKSPCVLTDEEKSPSSPISPSREINKLKDQLEQQAMQTRQALAQLMLVREQLISETNARIEAQARTQQLLQQNRELLEHLASLGAYTDPQATTGLTSANIALAPQSQLQMLFQEPADLSVALRKAVLASSNNNNLATINQQINSLGSINQQLTTLSHQLSGLNQQSQNLQNFQNISATLQQQQQHQQQQQQQLTPPHQQQQLNQSSLHLSSPPVSQPSGGSPIPPMNALQSLSNQFTNISAQGNQDMLSKELFQMNQELLNRLQTLNLGSGNNPTNSVGLNGAGAIGNSNSPHNSFFYVNPMSCSPNNNSPFNFLSTPSSLGNLTPSPMGTMNRNSYSNSPINDDLGLSIDKNLNRLEENHNNFMKSAGASNGNLTGASGSGNSNLESSRSSAEASTSSSPNRTNEQRFNTVMLKVTDESGNVTNQRKLSATPSFITRSTSEKVPNRSQMMSQVQRTAWARHTTK